MLEKIDFFTGCIMSRASAINTTLDCCMDLTHIDPGRVLTEFNPGKSCLKGDKTYPGKICAMLITS